VQNRTSRADISVLRSASSQSSVVEERILAHNIKL